MAAYRGVQGWLVEPWFLPRWMSEERLAEEKDHGLRVLKLPSRREGVKRAWFHAASVGELESLAPVIEGWIQDGSEAIVTVLSESAGRAVRRFAEIKGEGQVLYAGYSPWEGAWGTVLKKAQVNVFVTAKYEAWPELWTSLAALEIPLVIVGAKARRSLRWVGVLCSILGGSVPKLHLLSARDEDSVELKGLFSSYPNVAVERTGEPRWDRVYARASQGNVRARELIERYASLPRPWGVLAQVWSEDMEIWRGELGLRKGTLWVVPHRVDTENVEKIESYLHQSGISVHRTTHATGISPEAGCVMVDEVGFLLELYSAVDWAYIGGGFGVGMHSTIEPALYGIPIACGPSGERKFPEIGELQKTGQLSVVRDREELEIWLERSAVDDVQRARWKVDAEARMGATRRVLDVIRRSC
jgi:3-deoxy-D-manno-octulosonic-acid transferase